MTSSQRVDTANNDTVVSLNATTLDGVFSLQFNIASASVQVNRITSLNPNSTKIDVKISTSLLAPCVRALRSACLLTNRTGFSMRTVFPPYQRASRTLKKAPTPGTQALR